MKEELLKQEKLDIIILAGQSNAEGNGKGDTKHPYKRNKNILHMYDINSYGYKEDERSKVIHLDIKYPVEFEIDVAEEKTPNGEGGNLGLFFSKMYAKNNLENGRKILLIRAAVGGTGFARGHWGESDVLPKRLNDMVDYALSLNKENRIVAFLWHQGEHDAFENTDLDENTRKNFYYQKLSKFFTNFKNRYNSFSYPIICGGIVDSWKKDYSSECRAIEDASKKVMKNIQGSFVSSKGLKSNNDEIGNGDPLHFSRDALYIFGKRYYSAYKKLTNK